MKDNNFLNDREGYTTSHIDPNEEEKSKQEKKSHHWSAQSIIMVVLVLVAVYFATDLASNYYTISKFEQEKQKLTTELASAEKEIEDIKEYIENAQNPEFVEKMARENLKMVKPDETVYVVVK